jgi:hypothetical protein
MQVDDAETIVPTNGQLLGYIAHVNTLRPEHLTVMEDLTNRGFPTIISNYVNNHAESPNCSREDGGVASLNRCLNITNPAVRYFLLFTDYVDDLALVEMGIAIAADVGVIALIGSKDLKNTFACGENVTRYSDYENFVARRFFS